MLSKELVSLHLDAKTLLILTKGARDDFHEPDEQGITLTAMVGTKLDNAMGCEIDEQRIRRGIQEAVIVLDRSDDDTDDGTVAFNLATIIAMARVGAKVITGATEPAPKVDNNVTSSDKAYEFTQSIWYGFAGACPWDQKHPPVCREVNGWFLVADKHGLGAYGNEDDNGWICLYEIPNQAVAMATLNGFPTDFEPSKFGFNKG